jgi:hypothetical protein
MTSTPTASAELPDLARLEALARAANEGEGQHIYTNPRDSNGWQANEAWHRAASPAAVLELIALARRAALANHPTPTVSLEDRPEDDQQWAKVDPAVAFHLIERHAEDWADAGRLMLQWYSAISQAAQQEPVAAPQQAEAPKGGA